MLLYAVSLGSVLIVGAMGGTGLASLTLFSFLVMKEPVSRRDIMGVIIILLGPVAIAMFSVPQADTLLVGRLFLFAGFLTVVYVIPIVVSRRVGWPVGLLISGFAGVLSGLVLFFQKVSTTSHGRSVLWIAHFESEVTIPFAKHILEVLVNPYAVTWLVLSVFSTLVLQFAYKHDRAIRIIPMYAANAILVPVLGRLLCFRETLHPSQWLGLILIFIGVAVITIKREENTSNEAHTEAKD